MDRGIQIGYALNYQNPRQAISKLYESNPDEFNDSMTALIKLSTDGGAEETRVFSLSGCHLLAMFARTPVAKAFRKRVLDALDRIAREESEARAASKESDTPELNAILRAIIDAKVEEAIATEP